MITTPQEIKAQEALELLKGWFNNKMMVVLFRIQYVWIYQKKRRETDAREQVIFLNDIQHHFSRKGSGDRACYRATGWLKAFFRVYPERITRERVQKAWAMLQCVYAGVGLPFPFEGDGSVTDARIPWEVRRGGR
ncbi:MAG: hypothetical protein WC352_03575 [Candidatus Omnitrophota bacterium]|jgi:hypothetical protein